MAFYVLVNSDGIEVRSALRMLSVKKIQELVGIEGQPAFFEVASYKSFSDPEITILCDDDFHNKNLQPVLVTGEGNTILGQCLIVGTNTDESDFALLRQSQVDLIKKELRLIQSKS